MGLADDHGPSSVVDIGGGVTVVADGVSAKLPHLTAYTRYSVTVSAATLAGEGAPSPPVVCTTLEDGRW